jgi:hypothetical protein
MTTTQNDVREAVKSTVQDIINDFADKPDTDRETLIERLDEENDALFGSLVRHGMISEYDVDDLVSTAADCAAIIHVAKEDAWVEDDHGLWDGLTYGVLASVAFFSLRNLLYQAMSDAGHDSNDDLPFAREVTEDDDTVDVEA